MESDINKNITDEQLDELIRQSFCRQEIVDEINVSVMRQLHRTSRRRSIVRWGRIVAFAIGLPLLLFLFGWLLWSSLHQQDTIMYSFHNYQLPVLSCLLIPVAAMLYTSWRAIANFSLGDV